MKGTGRTPRLGYALMYLFKNRASMVAEEEHSCIQNVSF